MSANASHPRHSTARLLIVDDHEMARAGLRSMLSGTGDLEVVGEAASAEEAIALCHRLQPDLVLTDVRMPGMDGLDAIKSIRAIRAETKFIVITIHDEPDYVLRAFQAGATGYLLKDSTLQKLQDTVRRVLQGELQLDSELARKAFASVGGAKAATAESLVESLTHRELDVLRLIAEGRTNPEIAAILGISRGTVKTHVQRIIAKLGVIDRTQAAVKGVQLGLVTPTLPRPSGPTRSRDNRTFSAM